MWQVVQLALVETWLASWPVAICPLWQLAQLVAAVKLLWLTLVPAQVVVDLWQVSQLAVVETWLPDLVLAMVPLWQLAHPVLTDTLMWNLAGSQFGYPAL